MNTSERMDRLAGRLLTADAMADAPVVVAFPRLAGGGN